MPCALSFNVFPCATLVPISIRLVLSKGLEVTNYWKPPRMTLSFVFTVKNHKINTLNMKLDSGEVLHMYRASVIYTIQKNFVTCRQQWS